MLRIGIFGGTFDPPHIGHLILAQESISQLELGCVLWVLTAYPPHKTEQTITPVVDRLALLKAALADNPTFELSRIDIDRPAPHFAVDTVRLSRMKYPDAKLVYLMGSDSLEELPTWHTPQEFVIACDEIGVMSRPGRKPDLKKLEQALPGVSARIRFIQTPRLEIASSDIRERIAGGRSYRYFLPERVYQVIEAHQLYR